MRYVPIALVFTCLFLLGCDKNEPPTLAVSFTADKDSVNLGETVRFTANSSQKVTQWSWVFDGALPRQSTAKSPTVTYNTAGSFAVSLTAANDNESKTLTAPEFIYVREPVSPPFAGSSFIDPNMMTNKDPSTFIQLSANGLGERTVFDRRTAAWQSRQVRLYNLVYEGEKQIEARVNLEFSETEATQAVAFYAAEVGRIPLALLQDVQSVTIHKGLEPFGGGSNDILIHTDQGEDYIALGGLEEVLVHEACHVSLDAYHKDHPLWLAAQEKDGNFISDYARDNPTREDIAESFFLHMMVRLNDPSRLSKANLDVIVATIPNRMAYFDDQQISFYPLVVADN